MDILSLSSDDKVIYSVVSTSPTLKNTSMPFATTSLEEEPDIALNQNSYLLLSIPNGIKTDAEQSPIDYSNLQIVTLADGTQALVAVQEQFKADDNYDENSEEALYEPQFLDDDVNDFEDSEEVNDDEINSSIEPSSLNQEFQQVELDDGSMTMIAVDLLSPIDPDPEPTELDGIEERKRFPCTYPGCEKFYTTVHHLRVHTRNHTGARPYACTMDGCSKAFSTGYSLKAHLRTHTGEKPYGCTTCDKHFKTSGDLHKHNRTHTGEKPFVCPYPGCGKCFTTTNIRKIHIRSHTGERPYHCNLCGKGFASATNYKNHIRIHTGEKPYACSFKDCGKRFTEYSSLYKHQTVHSQVKGFTCEVCSNSFRNVNILETHKKVMHDLTEDNNDILVTRNGKQYIVRVGLESSTSSSYFDVDETIDDPDSLVIVTQ